MTAAHDACWTEDPLSLWSRAGHRQPVNRGDSPVGIRFRPSSVGEDCIRSKDSSWGRWERICRVWDEEPDERQPFDYGTTTLEVPNHKLRVSTADGSRSMVVEGIDARISVKVTASSNGNPDQIDLVLTPA